MNQVRATIARRVFDLRREQVEDAARGVLPDPLNGHYVVVAGRRFPPKQIVALLTGVDRADFNTHQARQILRRLGFSTGRTGGASQAMPTAAPGPRRLVEADVLRPFIGQWVAQRGEEVLVAADSPHEVIAWLQRHNRTADAMFRVPAHEWESGGSGPS